ncbi:MAG: GNAT family N-acetyltransferase [Bacteroidales bacterium]|nr:GNAT family N-acetyltransferase [Bacteroidales bacterium]
MIRYIPHSEIDFERWDQCIDKAVNGIFYAWSWYLDMCTESWDALVEDDYRAVMPLPVRKKMGIRYIYQPFFIQQLGVFSTYSLSENVTERFLAAIPHEFRYADFNMNTYNRLPEGHPAISGQGITHELDLIASYEELKKKYRENTRRNIRKAHKNKVFVTSHARPEDIIDAFRNNSKKFNIPFGEKDYVVLKHLIYAGMHKGMVSLKAAYSENNNFCAGIVFFHSHGKYVWLFSGATEEARKNGAMSLLVDAFLQEQAGREAVLDFEGSTNPDLARFYRGFGSEECVFLQIKFNRMPAVIRPFINLGLSLKAFLLNRQKR